mgnify:CR=1 FL=1
MMYNYPFFSFPYFRRVSPVQPMYYNKPIYKANKNPYDYSSKGHNVNSDNIKKQPKPNASNSKPSYGLSFLSDFLHQTDREEDESYFDLFGLKLYNDDLLLIGLIFFLYKEDVKDQYLFIALILLLLS